MNNMFNKVNTELFGTIGTGTGVVSTLTVTPETIAYYLSLICTIICACATIITLLIKGITKIKEAFTKKDYDAALLEIEETNEAMQKASEAMKNLTQLQEKEGEEDDV